MKLSTEDLFRICDHWKTSIFVQCQVIYGKSIFRFNFIFCFYLHVMKVVASHLPKQQCSLQKVVTKCKYCTYENIKILDGIIHLVRTLNFLNN